MLKQKYKQESMEPKLISFVGRSNSGKTTLITSLIPLFCQLGLNVGTIKHTHHQVEFDKPDKDSGKHKRAGSSQVLLLSNSKMALFSELKTQPSLLEAVAKWFPDFDLIISEGFKREGNFKIEVYRQSNNKTPLYLDPSFDIKALVSDFPLRIPLPYFHLNNVQGIYDWICQQLQIT